MTAAQLESIFFYVRNDYLITNPLMWGDLDKTFWGAEVANADAKGMMEEARTIGPSKRWNVSQERGEEIYASYQRRTFERLDESTKQQVIHRARADIRNLFSCMQPLDAALSVWRNVPESRFQGHRLGQRVDWKAFSSTSLRPHDDGDCAARRFVRYALHVPAGIPALQMGRLEEWLRNEEDEVLLPPITGVITQIQAGQSFACAQEIALVVDGWHMWPSGTALPKNE